MNFLNAIVIGTVLISCSATQKNMSTTSELATFAAGCFWGVESVFMDTNGVLSTEVGYTGGQAENVTYKEVCSGETGHAEAVKIIFDPSVVSYSQLLEVFFNNHDATQLNRQGPDVGTQYRSAIFVHNEAQRQQAQSFITTLDNSKKLPRAVTTVVADAVEFFRAEEYHQQYNLKNGKSCSIQ